MYALLISTLVGLLLFLVVLRAYRPPTKTRLCKALLFSTSVFLAALVYMGCVSWHRHAYLSHVRTGDVFLFAVVDKETANYWDNNYLYNKWAVTDVVLTRTMASARCIDSDGIGERVGRRFGPRNPGMITLIGRAKASGRYLIRVEGNKKDCMEEFFVSDTDLISIKKASKTENGFLHTATPGDLLDLKKEQASVERLPNH